MSCSLRSYELITTKNVRLCFWKPPSHCNEYHRWNFDAQQTRHDTAHCDSRLGNRSSVTVNFAENTNKGSLSPPCVSVSFLGATYGGGSMTLKTPRRRCRRPPSIKGDRIHVKSLNEWPIRPFVHRSVKSSSGEGTNLVCIFAFVGIIRCVIEKRFHQSLHQSPQNSYCFIN